VALVEEGLALRNVGITAPILALGGQYTDYGLLLQHRITPLVYRPDMIESLAAAARSRGVTADAHIKLDTGMGRIGVQPEDLRPAMSWVTGIAHLKHVKAGTPISYGHKWTARRDSVIATLPVGYADGYRRSLTNKGEVLVRGKRVKQVGTVCMDMTMIDVTDVPDVREAEEVVLMGDQGEERISADDLAGLCDTIPYE